MDALAPLIPADLVDVAADRGTEAAAAVVPPAAAPSAAILSWYSSSSGRGKLHFAWLPLIARAAASYARAASSAVSKVPSHRRAPTVGSRISAAHLPQGR